MPRSLSVVHRAHIVGGGFREVASELLAPPCPHEGVCLFKGIGAELALQIGTVGHLAALYDALTTECSKSEILPQTCRSLQASAGSSEGARFGVDARAFAQASRIVDTMLTLDQRMVDLTELRNIAKAGAQQRPGELRGWLCGYYVGRHGPSRFDGRCRRKLPSLRLIGAAHEIGGCGKV